MTLLNPQSREWKPQLKRSWAGREGSAHRVLAELNFPDSPSQSSGLTAWPGKLYLEILLPDDDPVVRLNLSWFDKAAQRLPEAMWLSFLPVAPEEEGWTLTKVNEPVSPFDVVVGGNRQMHAISDSINYKDARGQFSIQSLDAPLLALGK